MTFPKMSLKKYRRGATLLASPCPGISKTSLIPMLALRAAFVATLERDLNRRVRGLVRASAALRKGLVSAVVSASLKAVSQDVSVSQDVEWSSSHKKAQHRQKARKPTEQAFRKVPFPNGERKVSCKRC